MVNYPRKFYQLLYKAKCKENNYIEIVLQEDTPYLFGKNKYTKNYVHKNKNI